jgi:hypothetical protein
MLFLHLLSDELLALDFLFIIVVLLEVIDQVNIPLELSN